MLEAVSWIFFLPFNEIGKRFRSYGEPIIPHCSSGRLQEEGEPFINFEDTAFKGYHFRYKSRLRDYRKIDSTMVPLCAIPFSGLIWCQCRLKWVDCISARNWLQ